MSLTSTELNYLVWRYLQESGFDLAAFALEKHSQCLSYEHNKNLAIISRIEPGCLVNLVQKGILFTLAQEDSNKDADKNRYSFLGALLQEELDKQKQEDEAAVKREQQEDVNTKERFALKSEVNILNPDGDVEMRDENEETNNVQEEIEETPMEFTTKNMVPGITYPECLTTHWHPSTDVFAYGKDDSTAVINAIKDNVIAESVTLNHPNIISGPNSASMKNEITTVSWAPKGNIIVTAGINGELRAWSPDGKLKNIANTAASFGTDANPLMGFKDQSLEHTPELISSLVWSENGHYLLSIAVNNQICLWDGNNLNLIQVIRPSVAPSSSISTIDACWIDEFKFAISTPKNAIKVYQIAGQQNGGQFSLSAAVNEDSLVKPIGFLPGHNNNISILKFSMNSKLLASCSDFDYVIKVWKSSSAQESLELNVQRDNKSTDLKYHTSPIIGLFWLVASESDSVLLSISMEGNVNMWNATTGEAIVSANIFKNENNFNLTELENAGSFAEKKDALAFIAVVSPDNKWLAVGDDSGRISVWDVAPSRYSGKRKDILRCMGFHDLDISREESNLAHGSNIGICDLAWDNKSLKLSVSYKGLESAVFNWQ